MSKWHYADRIAYLAGGIKGRTNQQAIGRRHHGEHGAILALKGHRMPLTIGLARELAAQVVFTLIIGGQISTEKGGIKTIPVIGTAQHMLNGRV